MKIRIWARIFGTGHGPGLPLLITTHGDTKTFTESNVSCDVALTLMLKWY